MSLNGRSGEFSGLLLPPALTLALARIPRTAFASACASRLLLGGISMIGSGGDGGGSSGFSPPERAESFGHVLIDFTDRRYKTKDSRLPGPQWQAIVYSAEVTQIFDDEDAFDEVNIKPFRGSFAFRANKLGKCPGYSKEGKGCRWMQDLP
ncbi:hypothetical protein L207DRAFT_571211 [Hyaloscypha variabilis F]|uniref:Uncharacterized protein n=1 Tax=Hyaloscypha variabilis (strain UAMH 11265 / GT02V1 / F) TaxID=1149755 RepID=A0A2J6R5E2_HYAVF|nr:hypothetical protein L207DRAFT_571211 [Hyaloscypha variabilis F]